MALTNCEFVNAMFKRTRLLKMALTNSQSESGHQSLMVVQLLHYDSVPSEYFICVTQTF
jgi:hypothetical protein